MGSRVKKLFQRKKSTCTTTSKIPSNHIWNALEVAASSLDWEAIFPDILALRDYAFLLYFIYVPHRLGRNSAAVYRWLLPSLPHRGSNKRNFNFLLSLIHGAYFFVFVCFLQSERTIWEQVWYQRVWVVETDRKWMLLLTQE